MTQIVIDIGATANDGTGDPLRTAFNDVNLNFSNVFAAGPVDSNVRIANNKILTTNTNGNLVLAPNGIGVVQSNVSIVPNLANIRNLGSATNRWATVYTQYLDITAGSLTVPAIITSSISSDDSTFVTIADGLNVDGDIEAHGNITADYFIGNGSQLTGIAANYGNANVVANLAALGSNPVSTTGNISGGYIFGNGSQLTGLAATYGNANVATFLAAYGSNTVSTTGNITSGNILTAGLISATATITGGNLATGGTASASGNITGGNILTGGLVSATGNISGNYFIGNGSQLTGLAATYGNANVATFLAAYGSNTVSTTGNITSGNILTAGLISATGNVQAGNVRTAGLISATGNVTGGNILTGGLISATGNVSGGNILTGGLISATANVTAGNLNSPTLNNSGNIRVVASGNTWSFNTNGTTQFPNNILVAPTGNPITIKSTNGNAYARFEAGADYAQIGLQDDNTGAYQSWTYFETDMANVNTPSATVILKPGNTGDEVRWTFDAVGNLTIPGNIVGSGNILIAPNSASSNSYLDIYLTGGPDIHIASNDNSIVIGRDTGANVFVGNDGEVSIRTDNGATAQVWNFTDTGNTTFPNGAVFTGYDLYAAANSYVELAGDTGNTYMGVGNTSAFIQTD